MGMASGTASRKRSGKTVKVEFVGTFAEVNLRSTEWITSNPNVRLISETRPIPGTASGHSSHEEPNWTVTIEYEERATSAWRAAERR